MHFLAETIFQLSYEFKLYDLIQINSRDHIGKLE